MTDRLYAKYMWLISTIYDAGKISFEDIARKWDDAYINDLHQPLKLRTFHNHRNAILMQFGVVIECQRGSNLYYIDNLDALENDSINQCLLDSFAVSNLLMDNRSISDRILLEDVPSGRYYLEIITSAMRDELPECCHRRPSLHTDALQPHGRRRFGILLSGHHCLHAPADYRHPQATEACHARRHADGRLACRRASSLRPSAPTEFCPQRDLPRLYST